MVKIIKLPRSAQHKNSLLRYLAPALLVFGYLMIAAYPAYAGTALSTDKLVQSTSGGAITNNTAISGVNLPVQFDTTGKYYAVSVDAAIYSTSGLVKELDGYTTTNLKVSLGAVTNYDYDAATPVVYEIKYRGHYGVIGENSTEIMQDWQSSGLYFQVERNSSTGYTITITSPAHGTASGGGTYTAGQSVTLNAVPAEGYNFKGWYEGATKVSSLPNYSFAADKDITLTPSFEAMPTASLQVAIEGGGSVNGNTSDFSDNYARGTNITLTAAADAGYVFAYWQDTKSAGIISANPYTFIMGTGVNEKAVFNQTNADKFTVTFKDKNGKILKSASVDKGADATSAAPDSPALAGYNFTGWDKNFTNVTSDMTITATYARVSDTHTVSVVSGTLSTGGTSSSYQFDMPVTVVADAAPSGQKFNYWEQDGQKVSAGNSYSFFALMKDTTLSAIYVPESTVIVAVPFISLTPDVLKDTANHTMMFIAKKSVPGNYTLVESGIVLLKTTSLSDELTVDTADAICGKIRTEPSDQFYIRKIGITNGDTWYARAYLIYQDGNGNIVTVYSDDTLHETMN